MFIYNNIDSDIRLKQNHRRLPFSKTPQCPHEVSNNFWKYFDGNGNWFNAGNDIKVEHINKSEESEIEPSSSHLDQSGIKVFTVCKRLI